MRFINALELIDCSIQNKILTEDDGYIYIYRDGGPNNREGWYLENKRVIAKELMKDKIGQDELIRALKEKGVNFTPTDFSWIFNISF